MIFWSLSVTKQLTGPIDFNYILFFLPLKSMGPVNCLVTDILQNIFLCVHKNIYIYIFIFTFNSVFIFYFFVGGRSTARRTVQLTCTFLTPPLATAAYSHIHFRRGKAHIKQVYSLKENCTVFWNRAYSQCPLYIKIVWQKHFFFKVHALS